MGGQVAPNQTPLALASAALENFAPTGAENVPNAPLFVPYQVSKAQSNAFSIGSRLVVTHRCMLSPVQGSLGVAFLSPSIVTHQRSLDNLQLVLQVCCVTDPSQAYFLLIADL